MFIYLFVCWYIHLYESFERPTLFLQYIGREKSELQFMKVNHFNKTKRTLKLSHLKLTNQSVE